MAIVSVDLDVEAFTDDELASLALAADPGSCPTGRAAVLVTLASDTATKP